MPIDASKETYVEYRLNLQDDGYLELFMSKEDMRQGAANLMLLILNLLNSIHKVNATHVGKRSIL